MWLFPCARGDESDGSSFVALDSGYVGSARSWRYHLDVEAYVSYEGIEPATTAVGNWAFARFGIPYLGHGCCSERALSALEQILVTAVPGRNMDCKPGSLNGAGKQQETPGVY